MNALDYPVTFGYGATDGYYYGKGGVAGPYHRGNDRPTPIGIPVVVSGVVIGKTGATGLVSGPHLHTQEWTGKVISTRQPQNEGKPGVVVAVGEASQWGKYVSIRNEDGWVTSYCHLSEVHVQEGRIINEGGDMKISEAVARQLYPLYLHREPESEDAWRYWIGRDIEEWNDAMVKPNSEWHWTNHIARKAYPETVLQLRQAQSLITQLQDRPAAADPAKLAELAAKNEALLKALDMIDKEIDKARSGQ